MFVCDCQFATIFYYFCKVTSFIVFHLLNAQKTEILHDFQKKLQCCCKIFVGCAFII